MPPLGMRTLIQHLLPAAVVSVVAVGLLVGQSDIEKLEDRAEQGDALAQTKLGAMYVTGRGVVQDDAEAVKWFRFAAEQGYALAQVGLGLRYANGRGVPQDYAEAVKWYRLAAGIDRDMGNTLCQAHR